MAATGEVAVRGVIFLVEAVALPEDSAVLAEEVSAAAVPVVPGNEPTRHKKNSCKEFFLCLVGNVILNQDWLSSTDGVAMSLSTRILPQYSQTIIFLREAISSWRCGGILLKHPPHASR